MTQIKLEYLLLQQVVEGALESLFSCHILLRLFDHEDCILRLEQLLRLDLVR